MDSAEVTDMVTRITEGLTGFIWTDYRQNNCNTYLMDDGMRILIDPGHIHLFDHVERGLMSLGVDMRSIDLVIVTHAHPDHMEAASLFERPTMRAFPRQDHMYLKRLAGNACNLPEPDFFLDEGELKARDVSMQVIATPGHTPGSICLYWPSKGALFSGDVIFEDGVGRTDLPGGSSARLKESIARLEPLQAQIVLPGHGRIVNGPKAVSRNFEKIRNYWFGGL
jgi:glyoxylase-like metal-dependent hydrolase (beta-lactamase superfamily II)